MDEIYGRLSDSGIRRMDLNSVAGNTKTEPPRKHERLVGAIRNIETVNSHLIILINRINPPTQGQIKDPEDEYRDPLSLYDLLSGGHEIIELEIDKAHKSIAIIEELLFND